MKKDLKGSVLRVSKFLDVSLTKKTIDDIVAKSTFESMKQNPKINPDREMASFKESIKENKSFLRKGTVGDWKNYFTVAQDEYFDEIYAEQCKDSGLIFDYTLDTN